ncbi:hypothetical protein NVP1166O_30 [Vibrio phage 1.166.O._10N.261.51.C7]|nr:hypothetical protein NVP1166O_30 [Vibrio phage 1.166.O._10N.261.51.C7]AUR94054.1 hypothetical protein NVP1190O_30 [Vibrio phage 1.190.O._10N.286.51.F12]
MEHHPELARKTLARIIERKLNAKAALEIIRAAKLEEPNLLLLNGVESQLTKLKWNAKEEVAKIASEELFTYNARTPTTKIVSTDYITEIKGARKAVLLSKPIFDSFDRLRFGAATVAVTSLKESGIEAAIPLAQAKIQVGAMALRAKIKGATWTFVKSPDGKQFICF